MGLPRHPDPSASPAEQSAIGALRSQQISLDWQVGVEWRTLENQVLFPAPNPPMPAEEWSGRKEGSTTSWGLSNAYHLLARLLHETSHGWTTLELLALLTEQRRVVTLCVGPHVHLLRLPLWALTECCACASYHYAPSRIEHSRA